MRALVPLKIVLLITTLTVAALFAGCGASDGGGAAVPTPSASAALTPEQILTRVMEAGADAEVAHVSASYKLTMTFDADPSAMPDGDEAEMFLSAPVELSGTAAASEQPVGADITMDVVLAGGSISMKMGFRMKDTKGWVCFMGQWYELPPEFAEAMQASTRSAAPEPEWKEFEHLLAGLGVNPRSWAKQLSLVGEEKLDGAQVYHLRMVPDMARLAADIAVVLKSDDFRKLVGEQLPAEEMQGIDDADLKEMKAMLGEALKDPLVELWIRTDTFMIAKMTAHGLLVPPAEEAEGIKSIDMQLTATMRALEKPLRVQPPASPHPFSELEKLMGEDGGGLFDGSSLDGSVQ